MISIDYSMLSKTNVHHFAGNNVSHAHAPCTVFLLQPNDRRPGLQGLPNEKVPHGTLEGTDYMLTADYRLNWALRAGSSTDAPPWLYWMLVTRIS